jgi:hypothetical protein
MRLLELLFKGEILFYPEHGVQAVTKVPVCVPTVWGGVSNRVREQTKK